MKKITLSITTLIPSIALFFAVISQGNNHLQTQWLSFSLLACMMLGYLHHPVTFFSLLKDKAFISYLLFILWALCSGLFWSVSKAPSILTIGVLLGGLFSYLIGYASTKKHAFSFYNVLLSTGLALTLLTFYQAFALDINRPSGTFSNYNNHATFIGMILMPWLIRFSLRPLKYRSQPLALAFFTVLFSLAMALTLSRGAILFLLVCVFLLVLFAWRQQAFFKHSLYFLGAILGGYLLSALLSNHDNVLSRMATVTQTSSIEAFGSGRHLLWQPAWQIYLDHPFLGSGLNTFRFLHAQYKDPLSNELGYFVHNDFLQYLIELGPLGLLLFLVFTGIIVKRLFCLIQKRATTLSSNQIEAFALLSTSVAMLAHTFFTFNLYHLTMQIIFGFYLGRAAKLVSISDNPLQPALSEALKKQFTGYYQAFRVVLISALLMFGLSFYFLGKAEQTEEPAKKLDYYWKAGMLFPALEFYQSLSAQQSLKHLQDPSLGPDIHKIFEKMALEDSDIAINRAQIKPINYVTKANILKATGGDVAETCKLYEKALQLNPYLLHVRDEYAHYLIDQEKPDKALSVLWGAWDHLNTDFYQNGILFLQSHLAVNQQYGKAEESVYIEQEIARLSALKVENEGGLYIFRKSK